jgi:hypothetical protein
MQPRPLDSSGTSRSLVPTPRARARFCTLSGPLFIQAPRFTRWCGWFLLSYQRNNFKMRHRVAVTFASSQADGREPSRPVQRGVMRLPLSSH